HMDQAHANPVRRTQADDVLVAERDVPAPHRAAFGCQQAADRLQRGRLAGPVGAEEGDHAALLDLQRDSLDGEEHSVVGDLDVVEGQQAHFFSLPASSLISFQTRSCSALDQSLSGAHFWPSHSEMRPLPPPWWSLEVSVIGGIRPSASKSLIISSPALSVSPVSGPPDLPSASRAPPTGIA